MNFRTVTQIVSLVFITSTFATFGADSPARRRQTDSNSSATVTIPSRPSSESSKVHILVPGDVVEVRVFQEDDLTIKARIATNGTISFPFLGYVVIGSNTLDQATEIIRTNLAKDVLKNPHVTMRLVGHSKPPR